MCKDNEVLFTDLSRARRGFADVAYLVVGVLIIGLMLLRLSTWPPHRPPQVASTTQPSTQPALQFARGAALYDQYCLVCHGGTGEGNGPASNVLDPQPRNFRIGRYRLVSSGNNIPYRDDLIRTIRNGMAGTSMPAWKQFSDEQVEAVADYVMAVSKQALREDLARKKVKPPTLDKLVVARLTPSQKVTIAPEPPVTQADLLKAKTLFDATCAKCHQPDGAGRQDPEWKTEEGFPIASRNFTSRVYKGGGSSADLYTRIYAGMPGTPMASFSGMSSEDIWRLVHYVQWLGNPKREPLKTDAGARKEGN